MSAIDPIFVGDIGTIVRCRIKDNGEIVDVSTAVGAGKKLIRFRSPDRTVAVVEQEATFTTDGSDGEVEYAIKDGDINIKGPWKYQAKTITTSGTWFSSTRTLTALDPLE